MATNITEVADAITAEYPIIRNGLLPRWHEAGDSTWEAAEWALTYVQRCVESRGGIEQAVDAFAQTSIDFLRLQARFRQTRQYARSTAAGLVDELYSDPEEMGGHYLDGLAMTYAMWPNHAKLLEFYRNSFVASLPDAPISVEIGPGHGLLGFTLLTDRPASSYVALDISAPALDFITEAFAANGLTTPVELIVGDATDMNDARIPTEADSIVCCEVLEHVDDPASILGSIRDRLRPTGRAFLSTVANLEAIDHVYLYEDADQIRSMIRDSGFEIVDERAMELPGDDSEGFTPLNYACIVAPAG